MSWTQGSADQNLRAEVRAVEEGHRAWVQEDGTVQVVSHTRPGVRYTVQFIGAGVAGSVLFDCTCPAGVHNRTCKHTAIAARRLEREKLIKWHAGHWYVTDKARELSLHAAIRPEQPADPFEGLQAGWEV